MTTVKIAYGSETSITWTAAIASSATAARECTAIDNTSTKADDYQIAVSIVYPNSAPANDKTVYVYAGAYQGATLGYQGGLTGSDAAITLDDITTTPSPLRLAGAFWQVQNKTRVFTIPSIAAVFGGNVPPKFGLVLVNYSGQTLTTVTASYVAITYTNS
jgi:hypothetical protein